MSGPTSVQRPIPSQQMTQGKPIQIGRAVDLSTTPGGTIYGTTPGGSRIVYDRSFLMRCRDNVLSKSPPTNLPRIPGVTHKKLPQENSGSQPQPIKEESDENQAQFDIDM